MQFQVPQFIDIAPKIVGPLTLRQFLFLAAAIFPAFLLFFVIKFWLWLFLAGILVGGASAFAFIKVNGQPFSRMAIAAFSYFWQPRLYIWKKTTAPEIPGMKNISSLEEREGNIFSRIWNRKESGEPPEAPPKTPLTALSLKLTTTTHPIQARERDFHFFGFMGVSKAKVEAIRKTSGEREAANRIDYR